MPTRLLLGRNNHAIVIWEGATPVNVRSDRYPQILKDEIERLAMKMLAASIVRRSMSLFQVRFCLLKRKMEDDVCVNYRALNRETISDKFPISVIDELLDKLHDAKIFSKMT